MSEAPVREPPADPAPEPAVPDVLLVGAVPTTQHRSAPAKDLYTGALFARRARYADAAHRPWYVLSARRGLVPADELVAPVEADLAARRPAYRAAWAAFVVEQLRVELGRTEGLVVELHADDAQADALRAALEAAGAAVSEPVAGRPRREAIDWYDEQRVPVPRSVGSASAPGGAATLGRPGPAAELEDVVRALSDAAAARRVPDLVAAGPSGLDRPGLYAWWSDDAGAADLGSGLGLPVAPGLLYVGQAGATSPVTGRPSRATIWSRVSPEHGRGSTFHRTLAAVLAGPLGLSDPDDPRLDGWVADHLRVVFLPVDDPVALADLEEAVLAALQPPLNLQGMKETPLHRRLRELRRGAAG